jgi:polygalacturonase
MKMRHPPRPFLPAAALATALIVAFAACAPAAPPAPAPEPAPAPVLSQPLGIAARVVPPSDATSATPATAAGRAFDVRNFGAVGDGKTIDSPAINRAVQAAAAAGGGTVYFPAGTYASYSIRLASHVGIYLDHGATLLAADTANGQGYDAAEPGAGNAFQDFGHSHWHNSLMWGENIEDVSIQGPGLIYGKGLSRGQSERSPVGMANKTIALKNSRNITIRDVSILQAGHFGILATGVDNLTIDNLKIDTNRDGIDIDGVSNTRISNTSVNSPNDDAIVLKSSYALGELRPTENVTIINCFVSGYEVGSLLDGTYKRTVTRAPDRDGPTGRVKIGTESNGDFRNITISNVVFDRSRGLALETVDGSHIEDVAISNITMRDVSNSPIFLRLGARMRAPEGMAVGSLKRVHISGIVVSDADPRYASIISGIPGHDVEDVTISDVRILYRGGLNLQQVAQQPAELVNTFFNRDGSDRTREPYATPEQEAGYPEPSMFGILPAYGFFIRHARGIQLHDVTVGFMKEDRRPAFVLEDVKDAEFRNVRADKAQGIPTFMLMKVEDIRVKDSRPVADTRVTRAEKKSF